MGHGKCQRAEGDTSARRRFQEQTDYQDQLVTQYNNGEMKTAEIAYEDEIDINIVYYHLIQK